MATAGAITVDLTLPFAAQVEALTINDGDLLVFRVPVLITSSQADALSRNARRIVEKIGKHAVCIVLDSDMALDRLTAEQVRELYQRLTVICPAPTAPTD